MRISVVCISVAPFQIYYIELECNFRAVGRTCYINFPIPLRVNLTVHTIVNPIRYHYVIGVLSCPKCDCTLEPGTVHTATVYRRGQPVQVRIAANKNIWVSPDAAVMGGSQPLTIVRLTTGRYAVMPLRARAQLFRSTHSCPRINTAILKRYRRTILPTRPRFNLFLLSTLIAAGKYPSGSFAKYSCSPPLSRWHRSNHPIAILPNI